MKREGGTEGDRFVHKAVLVTGAASGIGRATAQRLAAEGGRVLCADVNEPGLKETVTGLQAAGGEAVARVCDVSDPEACRSVVAAALEAFGRLDVLCNVAGVAPIAHATQIAADQWNRVIAVNLSGTFFTCQAAIPHLLESRGNIVNTASSAGLAGVAYTSAYAASKGGVVMLTKELAVEFGRQGLRVNCVCPGGVDTPLSRGFVPPEDADPHLLRRMQLVPRLAEPWEIAAAIAYLASDEARYVNGAAFPVDGGQVA
jgi:NAD(P)-dependent dehydrogenase (short-subunit alcohol dehydrogenase family)